MNANRFRNRASFGKRQEYTVIAEMLKRGSDACIPLVDDQHIDCIIRRGDGDYLDVQIEASSNDCIPFDPGSSAATGIPYPRGSCYFIFYSEQTGCHWILPSLKLVELASRNKQGANVGRYSINLTGWSKKRGQVYLTPRFDEYKNNFSLLAGVEREAE